MFVRSAVPRAPRRGWRIVGAAVLAGALVTAAFFASTVQGFVYASKGSSGRDVKCVQKALNAWSVSGGRMSALEVDGDFGPKTKERVAAFQDAMRLDEDGIVGYATSRSLAFYASGKCKERLDDMRADEEPLYETGSSGQAVRCVQKAFNGWVEETDNGAKKITVDGLYGLETEAAVKRFQQTKGLKANGVANAETLHELRFYAHSVSCPPYFG